MLIRPARRSLRHPLRPPDTAPDLCRGAGPVRRHRIECRCFRDPQFLVPQPSNEERPRQLCPDLSPLSRLVYRTGQGLFLQRRRLRSDPSPSALTRRCSGMADDRAPRSTTCAGQVVTRSSSPVTTFAFSESIVRSWDAFSIPMNARREPRCKLRCSASISGETITRPTRSSLERSSISTASR